MNTDMTDLESMEVAVPATLVTQCESTCSADPRAIAPAVGAAFGTVEAFMTAHHMTAAGPARVTYTSWSPNGVTFTAAIPIADVPPAIRDTPDVTIKSLPESTALRFVHRGPYADVRETYTKIEAWLRARGAFTTAADWARYSPMWEEYLNDPRTTPPSELITHIYLHLR
jgi:effector-binding domain-containing protein